MSIDKSIDYVEQDGYKNYTKNSDSVTVPRKFKARKNAPSTKLAYITDAEEKQLKKQNPGTPHKGPSNVPSYDSFDAQGNYTSGTAMSAAETGSRNERDRAEVRASNIGGPKGLAPGATSQEAQDLRAAAIAAGAGQRVNPSFFDSRNTVSPAELAAARAINPDAFRATRGGGLGSFFTGGGLLGNIIRAIGNRFGLGKKYNEPTYDMRGLYSVNPNNLDIYNEFLDEEDSTKRFTDTGTLTDPNAQYLYDRDKTVSLMKNFIPAPGQTDYFPSQVGGITNTKVEPPNFMFASPQFQEGLDNSMYGADRMLFGADKNQKYYYGDVLPGGDIIQTDADGITNYDFDTPVRVEPKNSGILDLNIPGLTVNDKLVKSDVAPQFQNMIMQTGINETQKDLIDKAAKAYGRVNAASDGTPGKLDATTQKEIFDSVKPFDTKAKDPLLGFIGGQEADPMTQQEYKDYLISQGYI